LLQLCSSKQIETKKNSYVETNASADQAGITTKQENGMKTGTPASLLERMDKLEQLVLTQNGVIEDQKAEISQLKMQRRGDVMMRKRDVMTRADDTLVSAMKATVSQRSQRVSELTADVTSLKSSSSTWNDASSSTYVRWGHHSCPGE
jgi:sulfur transfer complex TusBCD TusB component (DsrH family)